MYNRYDCLFLCIGEKKRFNAKTQGRKGAEKKIKTLRPSALALSCPFIRCAVAGAGTAYLYFAHSVSWTILACKARCWGHNPGPALCCTRGDPVEEVYACYPV